MFWFRTKHSLFLSLLCFGAINSVALGLPSDYVERSKDLSTKTASIAQRFFGGSNERKLLLKALTEKNKAFAAIKTLEAKRDLQIETSDLIQKINATIENERKELAKEIAPLIEESEKLQNDFYPTLKLAAQRLFGAPRSERQALNEKLFKIIQSVSDTFDTSERILKEKSPSRAWLAEGAADVREAVASFTAEGIAKESVFLFELNARRTRLFADYALLRLIEEAIKGTGLSYAKFDEYSQETRLAYADTKLLFPELPDLENSALRIDDQENSSLDMGKAGAFVKTFGPVAAEGTRVWPNEEYGKQLLGALAGMEEGIRVIEKIRRDVYPKLAHDSQHNDLIVALFNTAGSEECLLLANGLALFDGKPCSPKAMEKALKAHADFVGKWGADATLHWLTSALEDFTDSNLSNADWALLQEKIRNLPEERNLVTDTRSKWSDVAEDLVGSKSPLRRLLQPDVALDVRYQFIQQVFFKHKIGWNLENGRWLPRGGLTDWSPSIAATDSAANNLKQFFESEKGTQDLPETLTRLDGSYESCRIFGAGYVPNADEELKLKTEANLIRESPWVVQSDEIENREPHTLPTINGQNKLLWYHKAHIANAYQSQIVNNDGKKKLAGILAFTRRKMILPNVIFAATLLTKDGEVGNSDFGMQLEHAPLVKDVDKTYGLPSELKIYEAALKSQDDFLKRYAIRNSLLPPMEEILHNLIQRLGLKPTDKINKAFIDAEIDSLYLKRRGDILKSYRKQYRREMEIAAATLRQLDVMLEPLRENFINSMPGIIESVLGERAATNTEENNETTKRGIKAAFLKLIDHLQEIYIREQFSLSADPILAGKQLKKLKPKIILSPEVFVKLFKLHGGRGEFTYLSYVHKVILYGTDTLDGRPKIGELLRFYQKALDGYYQQVAAINFTRDYLLHRFPALKQTDFFFDEIYPHYADRKFEETMQNHLEKAVDQFNAYQNENDVDSLIESSMPNLVLTKLALEAFPQFKRQLCNAQWEHKVWQEGWDSFYFAGGLSAGVASMIPMMSGPGAAVGVLLEGVALAGQTAATVQRYLDYRDTVDFELASEGQMTFEEVQGLSEQYDQIEEEVYAGIRRTLIQTALTGFTAKINWKSITRLRSSLKEARLIKDWGANKFSQYFKTEVRIPVTYNPITGYVPRPPIGEILDWAKEYPFFALKARAGDSLVSKAIQFGTAWPPLLVWGAYQLKDWRAYQATKVLEAVKLSENPILYRANAQGQLGEQDLLDIAKLKKETNQIRKKTLDFNAAILAAEIKKGAGQIDQDTLNTAYQTISEIRKAAQAELTKLSPVRTDGRPEPRYFFLKQAEESATEILEQTGLYVKLKPQAEKGN